MKEKKIVIIVLVVLIIAGVVLWRDIAGRNNNAMGVITGNGTVEATEVEISSKVSGRLSAVAVKEGDRVTKDQLLAVLDGGDLEGQEAQARGNVEAAEAALAELEAGTRREEIRRLEAQREAALMAHAAAKARLDLVRQGARKEEVEQIRAALRQAEVNLAEAQREMERARKLENRGAIPGRELDQAMSRRDVAQAQVDAARQRLSEAEAGARPEEVREVESAVAQAEAQVNAAKESLALAMAGPRKETVAAARGRAEAARGALSTARYLLEQTKLNAPLDGIVTQRSAEPGETVTPGMPILRLADLSTVWLRVYVPEPKVGLVKLGQAAEVTVDSYPGKKYPGRVAEISQKPEFTPKNVQTKEERVKLVFGVKVEVNNSEQELKPGMPADAAIRVGP